MICFLKKHPTIRVIISIVFISFQFSSTSAVWPQQPSVASNAEIRYIPIGDSYTIGTGAPAGTAWPDVLVKHLREKGINITLLTNPSYPGWTTQQAQEREMPVFESSDVNFATLMIGANDCYAGVDPEVFRARIGALMDQMIRKLANHRRMVVITIPDFSVTPVGAQFHPERNVSKDIQDRNKIIKQEAKKRNLAVADLFTVSQRMGEEPELLSEDKLHPSPKGHLSWEEIIFPVVYERLQR